MIAIIDPSTGLVVETQSHGNAADMLARAIADGFAGAEAREVTAEELSALLNPAPTLEEAKAAATTQVKSALAELTDYIWPRLKAESVRLNIPPYDGPEQVQYASFVQETALFQFEAVSAIQACQSTVELFELLDDLRSLFGEAIGG